MLFFLGIFPLIKNLSWLLHDLYWYKLEVILQEKDLKKGNEDDV